MNQHSCAWHVRAGRTPHSTPDSQYQHLRIFFGRRPHPHLQGPDGEDKCVRFTFEGVDVLFCFTPTVGAAAGGAPGWGDISEAIDSQAAEDWPSCGWPKDWLQPV